MVLVAGVAVIGALVAPGTASAESKSKSVTAAEARQAVANIPGVLADADSSTTTADADSVAETPNMDISRRADDGVTFKGDGHGPSFTLTLPGAKSHGPGKLIAPGTVSYDSRDGAFTNVVQQLEDKQGGRILNVIKSRDATEDLAYGLRKAPAGSKWHLADDGGAFLIDANNDFVAAVAPPTAVDARGVRVAAKYSLIQNDTVLVNHVSHHAAGTVYPVVADPYLVWGWYKLDVLTNRWETNSLMLGVTTGALIASKLPPPYSWIITIGGGIYAAYANWVYNNGGCMKFMMTYWGGLYVWHYYPWNHWYCR
jgi:hypothetical protein